MSNYMTLENNKLKMAFPNSFNKTDNEIQITFHRTLRIPDDNKKYPLPPSLGSFPLHHVEDFSDKLPANWKDHGGIFFPMHQAEAMWMAFSSTTPFALKIASGKVNAISGEKWNTELKSNNLRDSESNQDYVVIPSQPWLDGFNVGKGVIRQFVAVPLDSGFTVEEQLTGSAEHGGIQIIAYPMKPEHLEKYYKEQANKVRISGAMSDSFGGLEMTDSVYAMCASVSASAAPQSKSLRSASRSIKADMGMGAGGFMKQEIFEDKYGFDHWDTTNSQKVFVHLLNSLQYEYVTGKPNPNKPLSPKDYNSYNYPWFNFYSEEPVLKGSDLLGKVDSIASLEVKTNTNILGDNSSLSISPHKITEVGKKTVKSGKW